MDFSSAFLISISERLEFLKKKLTPSANKNPALNTLRDISIVLSGERVDRRNEYTDSLKIVNPVLF